jgi:hypothetical protein
MPYVRNSIARPSVESVAVTALFKRKLMHLRKKKTSKMETARKVMALQR